jgi:hypothetical protein
MLNRELVSVYTVDVLAQDASVPPVMDKCTVSIYVTDKNDNAPVIDFPSAGNSTVTLSLDAAEGSVVSTVKAHDDDLGSNAVLYFMISEGNEGGEFIIKEQTGDVVLNMPAKRLRKTAYQLVIMVRDSGSPPQIAVSTLTVILRETFAIPPPSEASGRSTGEGESSGGMSQMTLTIIICVVAGFLIVALVLAIAVVFVKRRPKRTSSQTPMAGDASLWAQGSPPGIEGPGGMSPGSVVGSDALQREDSKMTEISDIILSLDSEPMNYKVSILFHLLASFLFPFSTCFMRFFLLIGEGQRLRSAGNREQPPLLNSRQRRLFNRMCVRCLPSNKSARGSEIYKGVQG